MPVTCSAIAPTLKLGANSTTWLTSQIHSSARSQNLGICR